MDQEKKSLKANVHLVVCFSCYCYFFTLRLAISCGHFEGGILNLRILHRTLDRPLTLDRVPYHVRWFCMFKELLGYGNFTCLPPLKTVLKVVASVLQVVWNVSNQINSILVRLLPVAVENLDFHYISLNKNSVLV